MASNTEHTPDARRAAIAGGLLDSLPFALALCDSRCQVLQANRAFYRLVGTQQVHGKQLYDLLPELLDECGALRDKALIDQAAGLNRGGTDIQVSINGASRVLRTEFTPLTIEGRSLVMITLLDTTRQIEMTRQLLSLERAETLRQVCNSQIRSLSRMIEDVLNHASLAAITNSADALRRCAQVAREQLLRARRILDRIKALSSSFELYSEPLPLRDALHQVHKQLAPELTAQRITLQLDVDPEACSLLPDEQLIELSGHLLRNAIAASPRGGSVRLEARRMRPTMALELLSQEPGPYLDPLRHSLERLRAADEPLILLMVSDSGSGITERDLEHIFEPRLAAVGSDGIAGLGLTICRQIVQRAGGLIAASSRPGVGSRFWVLLPGQAGRRLNGSGVSADIERLRRLLSGPRASQARLLLAGRGANAAELYELLRDAGYRVRLVGSLESACDVHQRQGCDLALIDTDLISDDFNPNDSALALTPLSRPCLLLEGDEGFSRNKLKKRWAVNVRLLISHPWEIGRVFTAVRSVLTD